MRKAKLEELCIGITDGSHNPPKGIAKSEYLMLSSKNVYDDCITYDEPRYLSAEEYEQENKRTNITAGDVLLTIVGTVGRCAVVPQDCGNLVLQRSVSVLKPRKDICASRYLMYALISKRALFESEARGVAQKGIYLKQLSQVEIPIPSLQDQRGIICLLDNVQAIITARKQQIAELDTLVKARFVEMFGDPVSNAKAWQMRPLKETCALMTGNTPSRAVKEYYGSYIEWIKSDNIANSSLYLTAAAESLSEKGAEVGRVVHPGTILMTCIAGSLNTIGNVAIVDRDVAFNQQINAIIPHQYDTLFLCYLLKLLKPKLHEAASSALKCILNKGNLEAFTAIVPDMALQKEFSSFVVQSDKSKFSLANSGKQLHFVVECIWRSLCKEMRIWPISSF